MVAPGSSSKSDDSTTCVSVLILTTKRRITSKQAAAHLRFVPWKDRHVRYLPPGPDHGFLKEELEVRSISEELNPRAPQIFFGMADDLVLHVHFGHNSELKNGITVGLARLVIQKYAAWDYRYLHEVRVSRAASSRLQVADLPYNLFWINSDPNDTASNISDELQLLIDKHAKPTRENVSQAFSEPLTVELEKDLDGFLLKEYEYDYGALHPPYNKGAKQPDIPANRTEVLHPLFIVQSKQSIQIGHLTDLHVDVRSDVYEENIRQAGEKVKFNNWNKSCVELYNRAAQSCDVLMLTGDLIDYGRGHLGLPNRDSLGDDAMYHVDRNWFLFYYLIASGDSYRKPVYTILGNHDWRLNPYPPFAVAGAPSPKSLIHDYERLRPNAGNTKAERKKADKEWGKKLREVLQKAHGPGYRKSVSYRFESTSEFELIQENPELAWGTVWKLVKQKGTLDLEHLPTETSEASIAWYLLLINPFLDYSFPLPDGYHVLMLDWGRREDVLFPLVVEGKQYPFMPWQAGSASEPGPKAKNCLSDLQKNMVEVFLAKPELAKVLCVHAPPIGPYPHWTDDQLLSGVIEEEIDEETPGWWQYRNMYPDEPASKTFYHHFFAVSPKDQVFGDEADYGVLQKHREWLIEQLRKEEAHVRLVLSGHIHRNGLFVVYIPGGNDVPADLKGQLFARRVAPKTVAGAGLPAVSNTPEGVQGPLYVNTTSAGPRGHAYPAFPKKDNDLYVDPGYAEIHLASDGKIDMLKFRTATS